MGAAVPHVPARALRRAVRDQPVDAHRGSRSTPTGPSSNGTAWSRRCGTQGPRWRSWSRIPTLPDLVFTANAGVVNGATVRPRPLPSPAAPGRDALRPRVVRDARLPHRRAADRRMPRGRGRRAAVRRRIGVRLPLPIRRRRPRRSVTAHRRRRCGRSSWPTSGCTTSTSRSVPLDDRRAIVAPLGWDPYGRRVMEAIVPEPLVLDRRGRARRSSPTRSSSGPTIVMPACPPRVGRQLEDMGLRRRRCAGRRVPQGRRRLPMPHARARRRAVSDPMHEAMPFLKLLDVETVTNTPDEVRLRLAWREQLCTTMGVMHGGAIMSLADTSGAMCAFLNLPEGAGTTTIESKTNFLRAVRSGTHRSGEPATHAGPHDRGRRNRRGRRRRQARRPGHPDPSSAAAAVATSASSEVSGWNPKRNRSPRPSHTTPHCRRSETVADVRTAT